LRAPLQGTINVLGSIQRSVIGGRALQRQDLHQAVGEGEVYDFLIDIIASMSLRQLDDHAISDTCCCQPLYVAHGSSNQHFF
jgi:hypothetical protein